MERGNIHAKLPKPEGHIFEIFISGDRAGTSKAGRGVKVIDKIINNIIFSK